MERAIHQRAGIGFAIQVRQRSGRMLRRVAIDLPSLIIVRRGAKKVRGADGREIIVRTGAGLAIAGARALDVTNSPAEGCFEATCLAFEPAILAEFERGGGVAAPPITEALALGVLSPDCLGAVARAAEALADPSGVPEAIARQRVREVLTWLALHGGGFVTERTPAVTMRVRALLAAEPDRAWKSAEVARALAMSEATLRRRLAAAGVTFGALLIDVRMSVALTLLQATDRSVLEIALSVGYESPSRFAVRFRQRFGQSPSELRTSEPEFERSGTEIART